MRRAFGFLMLVFGVAVVAVGCGGNDGRSMMTGPGTVGQGKGAPTFMSLTPQGGATGVSTATTMGGQWITGGMMGGSHAGGAWGMMGPGWRNSNGSYGMAFSFTTA